MDDFIFSGIKPKKPEKRDLSYLFKHSRDYGDWKGEKKKIEKKRGENYEQKYIRRDF